MNGGIARTLKPKLSGDTFANRDSLFAVAICYSFIIMSPGSRPGSRRDPGGFFQVNGGIAKTLNPKLSGDTFGNRGLLSAVAICYSFIIMKTGYSPGS